MADFNVGAVGWVHVDTPEVWIPAEVKSELPDGKLIVQLIIDNGRNRSITVAKTKFVSRNLDIGAADTRDLSLLPNLNEPEALVALEKRFHKNLIYTFSGSILLAVNPFKVIPNLYDNPSVDEPHIYKVAQAAYRGMCCDQQDQALLISGESGAGKTETTKFVLLYYACLHCETPDSVTPRDNVRSSTKEVSIDGVALRRIRLSNKSEGSKSTVERMVLDSNPILEAFGNAKTLRNDNSSRFGKFIDLRFENEKLFGANIRTYLLEKVRVCTQVEGERSFHFFYQACAAFEKLPPGCSMYTLADSQTTTDWCGKQETRNSGTSVTVDLSSFAPVSKFRFLNDLKLEGHDDAVGFEYTLMALQSLGIDAEEIQGILQIVATVLHLGNLEIYESSPEASAIAPNCEALQHVTKCILVNPKELEKALCFKTMRAIEGNIQSPVDVTKANESCSAVARHLYGALFAYLCTRINNGFPSLPPHSLSIGVLDIFGFEFFAFNSFEQLCINFTNELLQQFFNNLVFLEEQKLYEVENIPWDPQDFPTNEGIVELLNAKPNGLFLMLDDECAVVRGSDQQWGAKIVKQHGAKGGSDFFQTVKTNVNGAFIIKHFAGEVEYQCVGFLDKNRDDITVDQLMALKSSKLTFMEKLLSSPGLARAFGTQEVKTPRGEGNAAPNFQRRNSNARVLKAKQYTVSSEFREQLTSLMSSLKQTKPVFVRCIKPNQLNRPNSFHRENVVEQMRYQGVLQAIAVSRAGYPVRWPHDDCWKLMNSLLPRNDRKRLALATDSKKRCIETLRILETKLSLPKCGAAGLCWAVGSTRVFLKQTPFEKLDAARRRKQNDLATQVQAFMRMKFQKVRFQRTKYLITLIQCRTRRLLTRWKVARKKRRIAATKIQASWRRHVCEVRHLRVLSAAWRVTSFFCMRICRVHFRRQISAAKILQRDIRPWAARKKREREKRAVLRIEAFSRIVFARKECRIRRLERLRLCRAVRILIRRRIRRKKKQLERERMMGLYKKSKTAQSSKNVPTKIVTDTSYMSDRITAEDSSMGGADKNLNGTKQHTIPAFIPRLPLNECTTPTSSSSSSAEQSLPRHDGGGEGTGTRTQSCPFLAEERKLDEGGAGARTRSSGNLGLKWLRQESQSARGFQPARLHEDYRYTHNHDDNWSSKDTKELSPKGARLDELSTDASSNLFTPRAVPPMETMKQWTLDDMHIVLSTLLEENRSLMTQLQLSHDLQERYETALSQSQQMNNPMDGLVEQVGRIDQQLQRQSKGIMSDDDLKALRVFARHQDTNKKKTDAASTACGADACKFM